MEHYHFYRTGNSVFFLVVCPFCSCSLTRYSKLARPSRWRSRTCGNTWNIIPFIEKIGKSFVVVFSCCLFLSVAIPDWPAHADEQLDVKLLVELFIFIVCAFFANAAGLAVPRPSAHLGDGAGCKGTRGPFLHCSFIHRLFRIVCSFLQL